MITLEKYHRMREQLLQSPPAVVLDTGEDVRRFRAHFGRWRNSQEIVDRTVELLVEYATDHLSARESFEDYLACLYSDYQGIESPLAWQQFLWHVQALGLGVLGRLQSLQLRLNGEMYYRFDSMVGDDVLLRRYQPNEFDEMVEEGHYDQPVGV